MNPSRGGRTASALTWVAALPGIVIGLLFGAAPLAVLVVNALGVGATGTSEQRGLTLGHLAQVFTSPLLLGQLGNSLIVGLSAVVITTLVGVPLAVGLRRRSEAGHPTAVADGLLTLPIALPGIIVGFFTIVLIGRTGLLAKAAPPLSGAAYGMFGLISAYVYFSIPRVIGPLRGAVQALDLEPENVARTLGAGRSRAFFSATVPQLLPAIVETAGTAAAVAVGGYGTAATLAQGVRLLPVSAVNELTLNYSVASASGIVIVLALVVVVIILLTSLAAGAFRRWAA